MAEKVLWATLIACLGLMLLAELPGFPARLEAG